MCNRIIAIAASLLLAIIPVAASAQHTGNEEEERYSESVTEGNTLSCTTDSVHPSQERTTEAAAVAKSGLSQQERADQLAENDPYGGALTILSMCIVVAALAILSILFLCFGRISSALQRRRKQQAHGPSAVDSNIHEEEDSGEVIAAIAAAMAEHYSGKHDMEDYILTIRSMKRSYSPWNSKIYNLRVLPQVKH